MSLTKDINIPNDLSEITLEKYKKFKNLIEDDTSDMDVTTLMISTFCDLTHSEVRSLGKNDYESITVILTKALTKQSFFVDRFTLNGVEYGFIPNIDDMTFGEYIDLDTFIKNDYDDMHKVMSILYRPIKNKSFGKYLIEDYTGTEDSDIMLHAPMNVIQGALVFFYRLGKELLKATRKYLVQYLKKNPSTSHQISEADGAGIHQSLQLLEDSLEILKSQQHLEYIKS